MNEHLGSAGSGFPPGQDRAQIVFELGRFLAEWGQILRSASAVPAERVAGLQRISLDLQARSRAFGFGGVAHHLAQCSTHIGAGAPFEPRATARLRESLSTVSELTWQAKQELSPAEQNIVDRMMAAARAPEPQAALQVSAARPPMSPASMPMPAPMSPAGSPIPPAPPPVLDDSGTNRGQQSMGLGSMGSVGPTGSLGSHLAPPPMLTIHPSNAGRANPKADPLPASAPPAHDRTVVSGALAPAAAFSAPAARPPPAVAVQVSPAPPPVVPPVVPISAAAPPLVQASSAPSPSQGPPLSPVSIGLPKELPRPDVPAAPSAAIPAPSVVPAISRAPAAPKLLVRSMLGLHAFDRKASGSEPATSAGPSGTAARESGLLGLRPVTSASPAAPPAPALPSRLPLDVSRGSRPEIGVSRASRPEMGRGSRSWAPRGDTPEPSEDEPEHTTTPRRAVPRRRGAARARTTRSSRGGLWVGALAAFGLVGGVIVLVLLIGRTRKHSADGAEAPAGSASGAPLASNGPDKPLPQSRLLSDDERFRALVAQIHGHGGKESPELRALVDEQAALQAKFVGQAKCEGDPATCAAAAKARQLLMGSNAQIKVKRRPSTTSDQLRPKWMAGLNMPDIPVSDDARVQRVFEYFTDNQVGRERFQAMLFRCGAYRDDIQATLIRYGAPPSLLAVVFTESGCDPVAKSAVGARGLWQFMPDAGRAYHLRIIEDSLDERLSPPKETEAAVHFLADLYQKFGAWELAFAAYNMGPFGLLARIERAEPGVGFWDLADADVLPDETAGYVPQIEAFALILANLQKLKFAGSQMRAPEVTSDLDVPPGTRLGLVARAASTSVLEIRALNLDILGDRIPSVPGERFAVQVPKEVVWQARETLQGLIAQANTEDQCVPDNFDWGKQRFTPEMAADCHRRLAAPLGSAAP